LIGLRPSELDLIFSLGYIERLYLDILKSRGYRIVVDEL
jgi:hypothetical protein